MGAIRLYAVYDRDGTEILDNATMQEVAEKIGSSKASVSNAISAGYSVKKRYDVERIDTQVSRADRDLLCTFDEIRKKILAAGRQGVKA